MNKKTLISLAALAAAVTTLASPIATGSANAMPAPGKIQPLSNGDGGGP